MYDSIYTTLWKSKSPSKKKRSVVARGWASGRWVPNLLLGWESGRSQSLRSLEWQRLWPRGRASVSEALPVRRTECSFCVPSDSELNVRSAVSRPLSGDDGAWQYGAPQETGIQVRNVPSQQQVLCLQGLWSKGHNTLGFLWPSSRWCPRTGRCPALTMTRRYNQLSEKPLV